MSLSLTVGLESGTLVIPGYPDAGVWVSSVTRPAKVWRRTRVSSPFTHGSTQTHATLEDGQIEAVIYVEADTAAELDGLRDDVEEAFFQDSYSLTVTEDGVPKAYTADCADVTWNEHDEGMAARRISRATVSIPVLVLP